MIACRSGAVCLARHLSLNCQHRYEPATRTSNRSGLFFEWLTCRILVDRGGQHRTLDMRRMMPRICLLLLMVSGLLFLIALYVDVRLTIELAGIEELSEQATDRVAQVRLIGTSCATLAYLVIVIAIGSLGWLAGRGIGICSSILAAAVLGVLGYVWIQIGVIQTLSGG